VGRSLAAISQAHVVLSVGIVLPLSWCAVARAQRWSSRHGLSSDRLHTRCSRMTGPCHMPNKGGVADRRARRAALRSRKPNRSGLCDREHRSSRPIVRRNEATLSIKAASLATNQARRSSCTTRASRPRFVG
jgi:hypothetical protein